MELIKRNDVVSERMLALEERRSTWCSSSVQSAANHAISRTSYEQMPRVRAHSRAQLHTTQHTSRHRPQRSEIPQMWGIPRMWRKHEVDVKPDIRSEVGLEIEGVASTAIVR